MWPDGKSWQSRTGAPKCRFDGREIPGYFNKNLGCWNTIWFWPDGWSVGVGATLESSYPYDSSMIHHTRPQVPTKSLAFSPFPPQVDDPKRAPGDFENAGFLGVPNGYVAWRSQPLVMCDQRMKQSWGVNSSRHYRQICNIHWHFNAWC